jgi:glycosyltransferase involved in cell wall biosynthesis
LVNRLTCGQSHHGDTSQTAFATIETRMGSSLEPEQNEAYQVRSSACAVRLLVLVPAYNPGALLAQTAGALLEVHADVWVLVDGSTDGSDFGLESLFGAHQGFRVLRRTSNLGKGATLLEGAQQGAGEGFTHILCFDADGQHPPEMVHEFRRQAERHPDSLVMGEPRFGADAPIERVYFRRISNALARLETFGRMRCDSLFGMRVYPLKDFLRVFSQTSWGRGYDFDAEMAVRLIWAGLTETRIDTPVLYLNRKAGGVTHFRYGRDNLVLSWMHLRLLSEALRIAWVRIFRRRASPRLGSGFSNPC